MSKNTLLFCTGESGTGKSYFVKNILPSNMFYSLKSATTRPMREGEQDGREYYFCDEEFFERESFATHLWVNEMFWKPGVPKWLYGVPECEIYNHIGTNLVYDVIQPKYVKEMIQWFNKHHLNKLYNYRILWFQPMINDATVIKQRQNMPDDLKVRQTNTCTERDFIEANIKPDHIVVSNPYRFAIDKRLDDFLKHCR